MLQSIRDKAQGWIAWAIVILISIPFALFGIQEYLGSSADPVVAEVEGAEIKRSDLEQRVREARENMRQILGDNYRQELFEGDTFEQQVLERMVDEALLRQVAEDWNMRTAEAQTRAFINAFPEFQNQGRFDIKLYEAGVRNRGLSSAGFESLVRQELVQQQLQTGVRNSAFVTDAALAEQVRLTGQKRHVAFARVPAAQFSDPEQVSEQEARSFYEQNPQAYTLPERVKLAYLQLNGEVLAPLVEVDEEALREYYEGHKGNFQTPEERRVRHILVAANDGNDAEKRAQAEALLKQLREGADFAELAKANSADPGSAANGGDLGWVNRGLMVAPFEASAFSLPQDELSDLVKTRFGYHIIQVTEIRGGGAGSFEDMRNEVEQAYRKQQGEELFYDQYERLANTAYESPDSLQPAAEALGLTVETTGWLTRNGQLPMEIDAPKVLNAAFSEDVLQRGNNSEVIELGPTSAVVVRIVEHEPERVQPFEDVRERVVATVASEQASEKAAKLGRETLEGLGDEKPLADVASQNGWQMQQAEVGRDARTLPAEVVEEAFNVAMGDAARRHTGVVSAEGDYLLIEVSSVTDGDIAGMDDTARKARRSELQAQKASAQFTALVDELRERSDIVIEKN